MPLTLYYTVGSAPCHQVMLTAKALNLDLELKSIDLSKKEHLSPEYVKVVPAYLFYLLTFIYISLLENIR